jgi:hypothetical protein
MKTKQFTALLFAALLALTVTGCSKDKDKEASSDKSPTASESVNPDNVSPSNLPEPPKVKGLQGAIDDLSLGECATDAGKQTVSGEITSSADSAADYLVTVSWTTAAGDVMGRGFKVLQDVAPGATKSFKIKAEVAEGATQCVPGAVYGTIG